MTINELIKQLTLEVLVDNEELDKTIKGCYIGDLLSWVMSKAQADDVWLTVMGNVNSIAVAALTDCACIVLTDNAPLDKEAQAKAEVQGICVLRTDKSSYETAIAVHRLLTGTPK